MDELVNNVARGRKNFSDLVFYLNPFLMIHVISFSSFRWYNQLNPEINKGPWTEEEEEILISAHQELGNRWAKIAELLPGRCLFEFRRLIDKMKVHKHIPVNSEHSNFFRSENSIKNHWNCSVQKRLDSGLLDQPRSLTAQNSTAVSAHVDSSRPALDLGNEFSSPTASCPPSGEHSGFTTPQHQPVHKDARSLLNTPRNPISKKLFISENSYSLVSLKQVMEEITPMDVGNDHGHNHGQNGYIISLSNNEMDPVTVLRQAGRAYKNTPSIISRGRHRLSPSPSSYISKGRQRSSPITPSCNFEDDSTPNVESVASCSIRHAQLNKSGIEKFNGGEHIRRLF